MLRFDAYTATATGVKTDDFMQVLMDAGGLAGMTKIVQGAGHHTFANRISVTDGTGTQWGSVSWGGRQADRLMIEVKGERTPKAVEALRSRFEHRCTRGDVCADFDAPRAFQRLYRQCRQVKKAHRVIGAKAGDWDDFPEKGRTMYLGAKTSPVRARLYEKGLQPEYAHLNRPDWVRLELQVRPAKDAKSTFAALEPADFWGASRWSRDLAAMALQNHVDPHPAGTMYRESDTDRAIRFMCRQYGAHLMSLFADLGSWECVGLTLRDKIHEEAAAKQRGMQ